MFTGIIQRIGTVAQLGAGVAQEGRFWFRSGKRLLQGVNLGDSLAVNGVCLTVVALKGGRFAADVSAETLRCTTLGCLGLGAAVNLEKALTLGTPLGGHLVSGHVDGVGRVRSRTQEGKSEVFWFDVPVSLMRFIAVKGSVCVDGVSLTVNALDTDGFAVNLVPHTCVQTTLGQALPGFAVNLEVDVVARYVARLLALPQSDLGES